MRRAFLSDNGPSLTAMFVVLLAALVTSLALVLSSPRPAAAQSEATTGAAVEGSEDDVNSELCFGIHDAVIERSPNVLNFGNVRKGKSRQLDVTVRGISTGCTGVFEFSGSIGTPTISGAGVGSYSILNNGCNNVDLGPQDICLITIRFKPTGKGQKTATLNLPPEGRTSFQGGNTVSLNGKGVVRRR